MPGPATQDLTATDAAFTSTGLHIVGAVSNDVGFASLPPKLLGLAPMPSTDYRTYDLATDDLGQSWKAVNLLGPTRYEYSARVGVLGDEVMVAWPGLDENLTLANLRQGQWLRHDDYFRGCLWPSNIVATSGGLFVLCGHEGNSDYHLLQLNPDGPRMAANLTLRNDAADAPARGSGLAVKEDGGLVAWGLGLAGGTRAGSVRATIWSSNKQLSSWDSIDLLDQCKSCKSSETQVFSVSLDAAPDGSIHVFSGYTFPNALGFCCTSSQDIHAVLNANLTVRSEFVLHTDDGSGLVAYGPLAMPAVGSQVAFNGAHGVVAFPADQQVAWIRFHLERAQ